MNVGKIIGSIAGSASGTLVKELGETIGKFNFSKEERAEMELKLKEAADKHNEFILSQETAIEQAYLGDISNARQMQVAALGQESWLAKHFVYLLAGFIVLAAMAFGIMLFYLPVPETNKRMVEMFTDIFLFAGAMMVLQFFFGSSVGSRRNSEAIRKELHKATEK